MGSLPKNDDTLQNNPFSFFPSVTGGRLSWHNGGTELLMITMVVPSY